MHLVNRLEMRGVCLGCGDDKTKGDLRGQVYPIVDDLRKGKQERV